MDIDHIVKKLMIYLTRGKIVITRVLIKNPFTITLKNLVMKKGEYFFQEKTQSDSFRTS